MFAEPQGHVLVQRNTQHGVQRSTSLGPDLCLRSHRLFKRLLLQAATSDRESQNEQPPFLCSPTRLWSGPFGRSHQSLWGLSHIHRASPLDWELVAARNRFICLLWHKRVAYRPAGLRCGVQPGTGTGTPRAVLFIHTSLCLSGTPGSSFKKLSSFK